MKKTILILILFIPVLLSAQQIFQYADNSGHIAKVAFSGGFLIVEQGGVVKSFSPMPNNYTMWTSQDNCGVVFSPDMSLMTLVVGRDSYLFKMVPGGKTNSTYQQYQSSGYQGGENNYTPQKTKCGYCNGTGRVASTVATYGMGGTKWCDFCKRDVPVSHCCQCKICPSCSGSGYR